MKSSGGKGAIEIGSANCPVCAASAIRHLSKRRKLDSLRYGRRGDRFLSLRPYPWVQVVYSHRFPDQTRPQTGRLNKSPHTVHAFATPYSDQNDDQSQGAVRGGNVSTESFCRNLSPACGTADCPLNFRYSHHMASRNPIRPDFIGFWRFAWRGGGGALWRRHCYSYTAAETAVGNPLGLPPKDLWHCEKLRLQRHLQSFRMLKGKSVDVSTAAESSHFLRTRRAQERQR